MGMFLRQDDQRTDLQKRVAQSLDDKARNRDKPDQSDTPLPDGVDDSAYISGMKKTTSLAWVWILIVLAVIVVGIWFIVKL